MTAVFAVRHPETTWNVEQRYQGRLEAPLSREGRTQARLVARAFAAQPIAAVYSSPLLRSLDLARDIAHQSDAPLVTDQRLTEMGLGEWEGLYRREIEARFPRIYTEWYTTPADVQFPRGERLTEVQARAQSFLAEVFARYPQGDVVVVTHSVVIQVLAALALALDLNSIHRVRVSNGGITTLCGTEMPGFLLSLNSTEPIYHGPVAAAAAQNCVSWKERRMTA